MEKLLLTAEEAAELLGIGRSKVAAGAGASVAR